MNKDHVDKHTELVRAALTAPDSVDQPDWAPIASAPKDGSRVLLWCPEVRLNYTPPKIIPALVAEGFCDTLFDDVWMLSRGSSTIDRRVRTPTHWMPLPEGPCTPKA